MITKNDTVIKIYKPNEQVDDNSFAVFGDNTKEDYKTPSYYSFVFDSYVLGYKNGAEAIYEMFRDSKGNCAVLDTLVYPLWFCYRHMTELIIKYLYRTHSQCTKDEFRSFIQNTSHSLRKAWKRTKPCLERLRNRVESTVDVDAIIHYIDQISEFDSKSFRMRYPVGKNLTNTNPKRIMIDIHNLHDRMVDFYNSVMKFSYEISHQVMVDISQGEIDCFATEFETVKSIIPLILSLREKRDKFKEEISQNAKTYVEKTQMILRKLDEMAQSGIRNPVTDFEIFIDSLTNNQLITLQAIFYCNQEHYHFAKDEEQRKIDYAKACILKRNELRKIFDKKIDRAFLLSKRFDCLQESFQYALDVMS